MKRSMQRGELDEIVNVSNARACVRRPIVPAVMSELLRTSRRVFYLIASLLRSVSMIVMDARLK